MTKLPTIGQLRQLIGNPDVYARQKPDGGYFPVYERVTPKVLAQHIKGNITVGTYINYKDKAKTLVFDLDESEEERRRGSERVDRDVEKIVESLRSLSVPSRCIGWEFSGKKGYHVWVVLGNYTEARELRRLGRAVLAVAGVDCEVFPKQDSVRELGNLVKLPGAVHLVSGKRSQMLSKWPTPLGVSVFSKIVEGLPQETMRVGTGERLPSLECMAAIQEGPGEGWRNHGLFHLATMLYRASLSPENVELVVRQAYQKMEHADFTEEELIALLNSAQHSGPICGTLPNDVQCAECPVRHNKGLSLRPGQVANGAEGELAVVKVGKRRKDGSITLVHPDLDWAVVTPKDKKKA